MALQVEDLRKLFDGGGSAAPVELSGEAFGFRYDPFLAVVTDGVLRLEHATGDGEADLEAAGAAVSALRAEPVPVRVTFHGQGGEVAAVTLAAEPAEPGVPAHPLARGLGLECAPLPSAAALTRFDVRADAERLLLTGTGPSVRLALLCQGVRLLVAEFQDRVGQAWRIVATDSDLTQEQIASAEAELTAEGAPVPALAGGLPAGTWLVMPGPVLVPVRGGGDHARPVLDAARRDGLGRALPARPEPARPLPVRRRGLLAFAGPEGFTVLAPAPAARSPRGWGIGKPSDGDGVVISYNNPPLSVNGALVALSATPPYRTVLGGVLLVDAGVVSGSAVGAYVVPQDSGLQPSVFAFGALGSDKGIGPSPFQVRGIALGLGWNSRIRLPEVEAMNDFPFIAALDTPGTIGGSSDPVQILKAITGGADPWVRPAQDELWVAAGLAFSCFEAVTGSAMAVVQTGADLTIALLGLAATEYPPNGDRKYAKAELGIEVVLKPNKGELRLAAALTRNSFLLDPNCRLRGGVALATWYGPSRQAGDFVFTLGGYHPRYQRPDHYPAPARLGFDWDLTGSVTVSGGVYFAITPSAVMLGGELEVNFHSGMLRAWLVARADALIQWRPFHFDIGISVRIGVQAQVKILFVKITIRIEIGASLSLFGPPTGGEATVHLWFISFTIKFGAKRDEGAKYLDWAGFQDMLPPPGSLVQIHAGAGLISDDPVGGGHGQAWLVSSAGFDFNVESAVPITEMYLDRRSHAPVERGSRIGVRPMGETGRTSTQVVALTLEGAPVLLTDSWHATFSRTSVPQSLWGTGAPNVLPAPGAQLIHEQLTGVRLASPATENGRSTGYISAEHLAFDPMEPGDQPLDPDAGPVGPEPRRLAGAAVIDRIRTTVDAAPQRAARRALADAFTGFGVGLGGLDGDLPGYVRACETAFTAAPLLVSAS
ncbi:DUF6603 domain-containing protein [Kitasatospora sp. NPDC087861]|uniref:DUF6603 domain-containing protein n=1 Tax=Kitasatospora sp. NPDC087861 TaxID=3364070 RepID=UPI00382F0BB2